MSTHDTDLAAAMDAMSAARVEAAIRAIVHEELASLGGHLLATYSGAARAAARHGLTTNAASLAADAASLATLGGYLTSVYGQPAAEETP